MKKILLILFVSLMSISLFADNDKLRVAVFDPTSSGTSIDEGTKIAVREIISSTIVNAGKFEIVERSLLEKVMQEQSFSNSGAVDDSDATEIGKLAGANKIILSVITLTGGKNMLSVKMIDVKTASVELQKIKVIPSGELLNVVEPITLSLIDTSEYSKESTVISPSANLGAEDNQPNNSIKPKPNKGEVIVYLPSGYQPKNEADKDRTIEVYLDKYKPASLLGSGKLASGFIIRIPNDNKVHKLCFSDTSFRVGKIGFDFSKFNFFELQLYSTNIAKEFQRFHGGIEVLYHVTLKESLMIK